ncbi:cilia- and flagella-associated protein 77 [Oryzias melastigma]|uniref:Cilia and flagella associated protein 77 n=1 Tax=Oryzias melastigma TaxID=30732 RepID=A0A3B3BMA9_ORYME|nr:cilia- and flagella-associated protein 77 [Oryzias melastigma]
MSSPRLGVVRKSMLTNPLLIKPPLGEVCSRGLVLPEPDVPLGIRTFSNGSVAEVLSNWGVQPSPKEIRSFQNKNFVSLNRDAVRAGVVTSKEMSQYRAQRAKAPIQRRSSSQDKREASGRSAPDIKFGVKQRQSNNMADILSHTYGHLWLEKQLSRPRKPEKRVKPLVPAETRTVLLRKSRSLPTIKQPVKLPEFAQVAPALNTFRDPKDRERALRTQQLSFEPRKNSPN